MAELHYYRMHEAKHLRVDVCHCKRNCQGRTIARFQPVKWISGVNLNMALPISSYRISWNLCSFVVNEVSILHVYCE